MTMPEAWAFPGKLPPAIDVLLRGNTDRLDIGFNGRRLFGVLASIGFPVDVIQYVNNSRQSMLRGASPPF